MLPPHFPIATDGLRGRWTFETIDEGTHELEGFAVTGRELPHKGGRTFGYRIQGHDAVIAYLPDHRPADVGPERDVAVELVHDVDLLIHDAQFVDGEEHVAERYGHATVEQAVALATEAGVRELALFHHSPTRSDQAVSQIEQKWSTTDGGLQVSVAVEGLERHITTVGWRQRDRLEEEIE